MNAALRCLAGLIASGMLIAAAPSPSLRTLFDRGILYYYAYDPQNAVRAFAAMAAIEPDDASAYWGQALALGPNINEALRRENFDRAQRAIAQAGAYAPPTDAKQRGLIHALSLRYAGGWESRDADDRAYRAAMAHLYALYQKDDTIAMLYAEALAESSSLRWTDDGKPGDADLAQLLAVVQTVLARDPEQPMANHLCIHAYDEAPDRTPAVGCARRLDSMNFVPGAEHLAHMPAHTWIETGAYAQALASSQRAYALIAQLDADPSADHAHALSYGDHDAFVAYEAAMMLGNYAQAQMWRRRLDDSQQRATDDLTQVRFGRWNEILATPQRPHDVALAGARALAYVHLGSIALAAAQLRAIANPERDAPLVVLARAMLAEAAGNVDEAANLLRIQDRQQREHAVAEFVPLLPAGEFLGSLYLRAHRYSDAEAAYRTTLTRYPDDPRALFGLARALQWQGKPFADVDRRFDAGWHGADTDPSVSDL